MAKWYEGAEEASFKPVAGGHVFRSPGPWLFGPSRYYLVDETQKAELAACLRRRQRLILLAVAIYLLIALGLGVLAKSSFGAQGVSTLGFVAVFAITFLMVFLVAVVPQLYLLRSMRPLLARLQRTDQRISFRDQIRSLAAAVSGKLLLLGGIGGAVTVVGNIVAIVEAISEDRAESHLYRSVFGLLFGVLLTSYFAYLAILKSRLRRKAN